ncbi:MAG: DUF2171 domain-containing protein, partial [Gemmataceae bacterium]
SDERATREKKEPLARLNDPSKNTVDVSDLEGPTVKLTQRDSPDGLHHFIPLSWVKSVDDKVHLTKNSVEAKAEWKPTAAACGC